MKKLFVVVFLASTTVAACSGKKASTTPTDPAPQEKNGDATGGATYGGKAAAPTATDKANPCSSK